MTSTMENRLRFGRVDAGEYVIVTAALPSPRAPTASCHSNPIGVTAGSGYIVRELSLFPSRFSEETRIREWDQRFESAFLQRSQTNFGT